MLKHALAVLFIGAASATSVAAHADWRGGPARYAPPPHVVVPRYCPPVRPIPSAYYRAPAPRYVPYRYVPYAHVPPGTHGWRKVWRQHRFDHYYPANGWHGGYQGGDGHHGSWSNSNGDRDWHDR